MNQVSIFLSLQNEEGNHQGGSVPLPIIHHHYEHYYYQQQESQGQQQSITVPNISHHTNPYIHPKEFIYLPLGLALDVNEVLDCLNKRYLNGETCLSEASLSTHFNPQQMHPSFAPHNTGLVHSAVPSMDHYYHHTGSMSAPSTAINHLNTACETHKNTSVLTENAESGSTVATRKRKDFPAGSSSNGTKKQTLKGKKKCLGTVRNDNTGKKIQFFQYSYSRQ
jgi:hypothetical protein